MTCVLGNFMGFLCSNSAQCVCIGMMSSLPYFCEIDELGDDEKKDERGLEKKLGVAFSPV